MLANVTVVTHETLLFKYSEQDNISLGETCTYAAYIRYKFNFWLNDIPRNIFVEGLKFTSFL